LFFEALAQKLWPANLDTVLADYVRQYRWKIATGAGLKALAAQIPSWERNPTNPRQYGCKGEGNP